MQNLPPKIALIYVVFLHVKNYTPLIFSKKTKMHFYEAENSLQKEFFQYNNKWGATWFFSLNFHIIH